MTALRLSAFAAIGLLAALQWASLLTDPPTLRLLGIVAVATLLGWALGRIGSGSDPESRSRPSTRWPRALATVALVAIATTGALLLLGVPLATLSPSGWDRLAAGVDDGLAGLGGSFDYPFGGTGEWARLLLVATIVPLTIAAAILTFRPGRDPARVPIAGLIVLVAAFAIPAVARPTAAPLLWGGALLVPIVVWLWGGRVRTAAALALVGGFGVAAVPVASGLAAGSSAVDYESWALPGVERGITFDWEPSYGPIDWPRTGRVLFRVHAERPSFWRVDVLDEFYADGWRRSGAGGEAAPAEPGPTVGPVSDPDRTVSAWFSIRDLVSPLLISPGTPLAFDGVDGSDRDRDGTTHVDEQPLRAGESYSVTAWAPDPQPSVLRAASRRYRRPLRSYTRLALAEDASLESIAAPAHLDLPLFGHQRGVERARRRLAETAYGRVARLAEQLTADASDGYGAALAISNHLRRSYDYDERPPSRRLPLRAFLLRDEIGYCQQFSGAMALMLRMVGVPARVATGFAPGTPLANGRGYEVTDLDAHSWVEVYFNGIGWLPFDPTPPTAVAPDDVRGAAAFGVAGDRGGGERGSKASSEQADAAPVQRPDGGVDPPVPPLGVLAALAAVVVGVPPLRSLRHRRLAPAEAAEREAEELRRVLRATGWAREGSATLLIAEDRLRRARHREAASYVRRFRDRLYGAEPGARPTLAERRSARRDLAAGNGFRDRLRLLAAMPPGAPLRGKRRS
ncbi:MAG TPA: transglutaminaseTgpA domain-containing protein [Solirubrobacterales bacterium]|nr:transglutaminaseTgpA domain-containing protein [Solirubrobacterales bacterium]